MAVLNIHASKSNPNGVFIGRNKSNPNEHFGNPASHLDSHLAPIKVKTRDEAVYAFLAWLSGTDHQDIEPTRREWILQNLHLLRNKDLVCFCAPKLCHGHVLTQILAQLPEPTPDFVNHLGFNEVFVFGSNMQGFHGAGSAGYAMYGTAKNQWRNNPIFQQAYKGTDKRGLWAVLGNAAGYQEGLTGRSYAVITVEKPGEQGRVNLPFIEAQLRGLNKFAKQNPQLKFLTVKLGLSREHGGYSFFTPEQMRQLFKQIHESDTLATNIHLPSCFEVRTPALVAKELLKQPLNSLMATPTVLPTID